MQLWQMNVVGRFLLADGSPKALTGSMTIPGSCQRPVDAPGADPGRSRRPGPSVARLAGPAQRLTDNGKCWSPLPMYLGRSRLLPAI